MRMFSEINEMLQTTKASLSISGLTFATAYGVFADVIPVFTALAALILAIYSIVSKRRRNRREEVKAQEEKARAQELHQLKVDILKKEINE